MGSSAPHRRSDRARVRAFVGLTLVLLVVATVYVLRATTRGDEQVGEAVNLPAATPTPPAATEGDPPGAGSAPARTRPRPPRAVVFQHVKRDSAYAHMALTDADARRPRRVTPLVCERAYFAAGVGLCLKSRQGLAGPRFQAKLIGDDFRVRRSLSLPGTPSRARVSPDGRYGATTSFVTGHSYADLGEFSTHTQLIDMRRGKAIADLEDFTVTHGGRAVENVDRNFWGVTFARDSDRFYATMRIGSGAWLVEGSVRARRARTLHVNVECPSLSPDQTRIAYKKAADEGGAGGWRLHVLDLRTMRETALAETRTVDDQAEWLDADTVLYGLSGDVWAVPADGGGRPRRFISDALSPAVLRD
jgi:hypothetical protein